MLPIMSEIAALKVRGNGGIAKFLLLTIAHPLLSNPLQADPAQQLSDDCRHSHQLLSGWLGGLP